MILAMLMIMQLRFLNELCQKNSEPRPLRQVFKIRHIVSKVELCSYCCWILMSKSPKGRQEPGPLFFTATAAMAGGKQLFEGAHLTGGNSRFCRKSSKCRNYALFVGQIIKYALRIILGFGSNGPLQTKILTQMCPFKFLGFKSN